MSKIWWTKMEHTDDYIAHYSMLSDSEIVADVRRSIASFANHTPEGDDFGAKMVRKALGRINEKHDQAVEAGSLGGKAKAAKTITAAATHREAGDESTTGCNKLTADGDIREDSLNTRDTGDRGYMESGTSANHYDQETKISTNSPAGAGANFDSTQTNKRPDASSGNAEGVILTGSTITRNGSRAACTSATSGQTSEAPLSHGEGSTPEIERKSASLPSPTPIKTDPKPTKKAKAEVKPEEQKYPHGEFENIMLTTKEYTSLCERLDDADSLIEEADGYFEAQPDKKRKYKSHYAMLLNWDRRRKEFEGVKPRKFKTAVDQDREEIKWLSDYYAKKERGENPPLPKIKMVGSA